MQPWIAEHSSLFFAPTQAFAARTRIRSTCYGLLEVQGATTRALQLVGETRTSDLAATTASVCLTRKVDSTTGLGAFDVGILLTTGPVRSRNLVRLLRAAVYAALVFEVTGDGVALPVRTVGWSIEVAGVAVLAAIDSEQSTVRIALASCRKVSDWEADVIVRVT